MPIGVSAAPYVEFEKVGDRHGGEIVGFRVVQKVDFDTRRLHVEGDRAAFSVGSGDDLGAGACREGQGSHEGDEEEGTPAPSRHPGGVCVGSLRGCWESRKEIGYRWREPTTEGRHSRVRPNG